MAHFISPSPCRYRYRAECTLDASPERILEYILPSPKGLRGKWDKNVKESEVIEHINKVKNPGGCGKMGDGVWGREDDGVSGNQTRHSVCLSRISPPWC